MKKSLKFRKSKTGFTLVELVIVIAIVIILSVISVPIYRGYVDKAKWAEGYALFGTILSAQKAYFSEYGNFWALPGWYTCYNESLGVDARGNKYFTYFGGWSHNIKRNVCISLQKPLELLEGKKFVVMEHNNNKPISIYEVNS